MTLVESFDKFNCDKGNNRHRYDRVYEPIFEPLRDKEFTVLEIGILGGASIEALLEYAPKAKIVGLDTFERINSNEISILEHPNVTGVKGDSTKPSNDYFKHLHFDIIIDDGLHTHDAQRLTFQNYFPHLSSTGVYFIEDVWPFDRMGWMEKQHPWLKKHPTNWTDEKYQQLLKTISPYTVAFHDIRDGYYPDTFIIEVRK